MGEQSHHHTQLHHLTCNSITVSNGYCLVLDLPVMLHPKSDVMFLTRMSGFVFKDTFKFKFVVVITKMMDHNDERTMTLMMTINMMMIMMNNKITSNWGRSRYWEFFSALGARHSHLNNVNFLAAVKKVRDTCGTMSFSKYFLMFVRSQHLHLQNQAVQEPCNLNLQTSCELSHRSKFKKKKHRIN
jgi:hypothetical protein